jgi:hypothetical protein
MDDSIQRRRAFDVIIRYYATSSCISDNPGACPQNKHERYFDAFEFSSQRTELPHVSIFNPEPEEKFHLVMIRPTTTNGCESNRAKIAH